MPLVTADCPTPDVLDAIASGAKVEERVRAHIETCEACRTGVERLREDNSLLGRLANALSSGGDAPHRRVERQVEREGLIPGYLIKTEIHRGGQGVVYRAVQVATNRPVAIKMLLDGTLATGRQRRRFEREIEIVAGLRHPGIVTVYESGVTPDGRVYLAMEFIDGQSLDHAAPGPAIDRRVIRERIRLIARVCEAVQYAHQRGVIHRDLKPGNILIDGEQRPHVVDFGLAKPAGERAELAAMTRSGEFLGTIAYASPEQVSRATEDIGTLSDVYSLGVVLYELLTGAMPYPVDGSLADAVRHITATPPRPPKSVNAAIDAEVSTILLKALAKNPSRRYTSPRALGADLEAYLAGNTIEARRDSTIYVLRKTLLSHRWAFTGAAAGVLALAGVAATMSVLYTRMLGAEARALERGRLAMERLEALQLAEGVFGVTLSHLDPEYAGAGDLKPGAGDAGEVPTARLIPPGGDITLRAVFDAMAPQAEAYAARNPRLGATLHSIIGRNYSALGLHDAALTHLRRAAELHESIGEIDPEMLAANRAALGWALVHTGQAAAAVETLKDALVRVQGLTRSTPQSYPRVLFALGAACRSLRQPAEADGWYAMAGQAYAEPEIRDDEGFARVARERGVLMRSEGKDAQRRQVLSEALRDLRVREGKGSALALLMVELAQPRVPRDPALGDRAGPRESSPELQTMLDEAITLCRADSGGVAAITLARALAAKAVYALPPVRSDLSGRGAAGPVAARLAGAEGFAREAVELSERTLGAGHPVCAEMLLIQSRVREAQDDLAGADELLERAAVILRQSFGPRNAPLADALRRRASIARAAHDTPGCIRLLREALEAFGPTTDARMPREIVNELGMELLERATADDAREAESHFRRVLATEDYGAGRTPPWKIIFVRAAIGRALVLQEKDEEGYGWLRGAYADLASPAVSVPRHKMLEAIDWLEDACRRTGREEQAQTVRASAHLLPPPPGPREGMPR